MDQLIAFPFSETIDMLKREALSPPIGEWLIHEGLISEKTLKEALDIQRLHGGRIGEILTKNGKLSVLSLYRVLAKQQKIPLVDLVSDPPDGALLEAGHLPTYQRLQAIPYRRAGGTLMVATTDIKRFERQENRIFGEDVTLLLTSPRDIQWTLERVFGAHFSEKASETLCRELPHYALRREFEAKAPLRFGVLLRGASAVSGVVMAWMFPSVAVSALLLLFSVFFLTILLFKLLLIRKGLHVRSGIMQKCDVPLADHVNCPVYTILVPLYDEAKAVPDLLESLKALDYPADRLDIKLITESNDLATRAAILAERPDARFHLVTVPYSLPQTKPKACNYALQFAEGEFVAIYDAEDNPAPSQLRHAVAVFRAYPEVACLQACLNYYNARENLLTRLFSLEYAMLFNVMLPALFSLKIPIPLGGTSNHLRRSVLEGLGAWDAYNVTEDADLGVRLASEGYVTLPFPSLTREEAPIRINAWLKQRARWIKGYIQTWTVLARTPGIRRLELGNTGFWGIHFFIGAASFSYVISPFLWMAALWWLFMPPSLNIPVFVHQVCWFTLGASLILQWGFALVMRKDGEYAPSWLTILTWPFYFSLHAVASIRSVWQLIFAPYQWDKTSHHVTKIKRTI